MNRHWTRWIHASLSTHFVEFAKKNNIRLFVEATNQQLREFQEWCEARWDGPYIRQFTKTSWRLDIEINILVTTNVTNENAHRHKAVVGIIQEAFVNVIEVFRYGNSTSDTQDLLGCLKLRSDNREAIITSYFGKIESDVSLEQSVVEAHYSMELRTGE